MQQINNIYDDNWWNNLFEIDRQVKIKDIIKLFAGVPNKMGAYKIIKVNQ